MGKFYKILFLFLAFFGEKSIAQISLTGGAYTQNFNSLANTGTSSVVPAGWAFSESGSGANTVYTAGTGTGNTGDTYSFGTAAADRAFGGLQSGSLIPIIGAQFTNNTGGTITDLSITYIGEQWRLGATGRNDRMDFQYSTSATSIITGTWTDENSLDFTAPNSTGTVGALDGNVAANRTSITLTITGLSITNGSTFWIRWNDLNASGADDGLGIDDFSITPTFIAPNTLTTSAVVGSPFSVSCLAGASLNVDFTSVGTFTAGNVYSAEISDAAGSFALPTVIGTLTSTANSGTIASTIPANMASGGTYRIRVVSNLPLTTGTDNGTNLAINLTGGACGISTSAIVGSPFTVACLSGTAVNVDFTSVGTFTAGNVYTAQLSDAAGSFTAPVTIGTLTSTANSGTIASTIPAGTLTGAGYRIRVVSANTAYNGSDNGTNLTINFSGVPCGITTGVISGSPFTVDCTTFQVTTVPFTSNGNFNAGNIFRAQLSDASGSFAFPITIGELTLSGVSPTSTIPSTILAGLTPSANYRIRVVSTNPITTGTDNGVDLSVTNALSPCYGPIIVNEISQGGSGNKEYFELLVVANDPCATIDIRNFIIDDNNGDFSNGAASGAGIAAGHMRFTSSNQWSNVPSGSLIVIYNSSDINTAVPADDPSDLIIPDKVYILPSNSTLLEGCVTRPTSTDNSYSPCVYGIGNWNYISLANGEDAAQVRYPNGVYSHGFSWGTATLPAVMDGGPDNLLIGTTTTLGQNIGFENTTNNDYTLAANYQRGSVPTDETPGAANSAVNAAFIATLICTALPVELIDFNVIKHEKFNYIFWTTATETNTSHFVLERSTDMENFIQIAQITASGNSNSPRNYSCADDHPETGYSYYRLKIVDLNGEIQYSNVRMVFRQNAVEMPTLNGNIFHLSTCETGTQIKVFDATGRLIEEKMTTGENYSIEHLQNGFYLIHITCNRTEYIFKTSLQK